MRLGLPRSVPPIVFTLARRRWAETVLATGIEATTFASNINDQRFLAWPLALPQLALDSKLSEKGKWTVDAREVHLPSPTTADRI